MATRPICACPTFFHVLPASVDLYTPSPGDALPDAGSHADVDHVGRTRPRPSADIAVGELAIGDGNPGRAAVGSLENAPAGRAEVVNLRLEVTPATARTRPPRNGPICASECP